MIEALHDDFSKICQLNAMVERNIQPHQILWFKYAVKNGYYQFIYDRNSNIAGYFCWAKVSKESILQLKHLGVFPSYEYEYNEGPFVLVLDVLNVSKVNRLKKEDLRNWARKQKLLFIYRSKLSCWSRSHCVTITIRA